MNITYSIGSDEDSENKEFLLHSFYKRMDSLCLNVFPTYGMTKEEFDDYCIDWEKSIREKITKESKCIHLYSSPTFLSILKYGRNGQSFKCTKCNKILEIFDK